MRSGQGTRTFERARRRAPSLRFQVTDGRSLPFDDETFHGVVFATTL